MRSCVMYNEKKKNGPGHLLMRAHMLRRIYGPCTTFLLIWSKVLDTLLLDDICI